MTAPRTEQAKAPCGEGLILTLTSVLIIVIMAALFALAVVFIARNGGWSSEKGCHGDCAKCHESCGEKPETGSK